MAKMKNYTDPSPDTGRTQLAETPFGSSQRLAEYLRANAQPNEFRITTGAPALSIEATDEAYAAALDAYERDTGTGKYAVKEVQLREPRAADAKPAQSNDARTPDEQASETVIAAIPGYDDLSAEEIVGMADDLEPNVRQAVARYEATHKNRKSVMAAIGIDAAGSRQGASSGTKTG